jgi:hypothetical protein
MRTASQLPMTITHVMPGNQHSVSTVIFLSTHPFSLPCCGRDVILLFAWHRFFTTQPEHLNAAVSGRRIWQSFSIYSLNKFIIISMVLLYDSPVIPGWGFGHQKRCKFICV